MPEITYPPLKPKKEPPDLTQSINWKYFTPEEQQALLATPIMDASQEIALLRYEVNQLFKSQAEQPPTTPEETRSNLMIVSLLVQTIGSLVRYQAVYRKEHNPFWEMYEEAMHIFRIRFGVYRLMHNMGFSVPDGVLDFEPDLLPKVTLLNQKPDETPTPTSNIS